MPEVWVLGSKHPKANASVEWESPFPNFSNADILIVNLQSLDKDKLTDPSFKDKLYEEARKGIFDMLMTGDKTVIVIMSSKLTDLDWLPMCPVCRSTAPARVGKMPDSPVVRDYMKNVETCPYYFHDVNVDYFNVKTNPKSVEAERYHFSSRAIYGHFVRAKVENEIQNVAKQTIGGEYRAEIYYGQIYTGLTSNYEGMHLSGITLFLPAPSKRSTETAIDSLLDSLIGVSQKEPMPPKWEDAIDMPKLSACLDELQKVENQIQALNKRAGEISEDIRNVTGLRRLLWADGVLLEKVVKEAFVILGFQEIRKLRAENLDDWVIDFKHIKEFEHGVFEVKASEKRTSLADLTQCNKWVEDYLLEGKKVKGIFLPNQYRLNDIRKSIKEREQFAPNELEYALKREICILPTNQVFNAVLVKMKTGQEPTRAVIEKRIAESNGPCVLT